MDHGADDQQPADGGPQAHGKEHGGEGERAPLLAAASAASSAPRPSGGVYSGGSSEWRAAVAAAAVAAAAASGSDPSAAGTAAAQRGPPPRLSQLRSLSRGRRPEVWGWLSPTPGTKLPRVLLQGRGVAIGRGREAYQERLPQLVLSRAASLASAPPSFGPALSGASLDGTGSGALARHAGSGPSAVWGREAGGAAEAGGSSGTLEARQDGGGGSSFVEVADGRVSRLHAWVKWDSRRQEAVVEDLSSNGTFVNGQRLGRGRRVPLRDGDRLSLVLSVAPLAEQAFTFHRGDPRALDSEASAEWALSAASALLPRGASRSLAPQGSVGAPQPSAASVADTPFAGAGGALSRSSSAGFGGSGGAGGFDPARRLARSNTNDYSTPQATTLEDLQCQICLGTLRACVALQPCGHNFCAPCLSHHLAALLTGGLPLACPLRCAPPERVVVNAAVRQLLSGGVGGEGGAGTAAQRAAASPAASLRPYRRQASVAPHGGTLETLPELTSDSSHGSLSLPPGSQLSAGLASALSAGSQRQASWEHRQQQLQYQQYPQQRQASWQQQQQSSADLGNAGSLPSAAPSVGSGGGGSGRDSPGGGYRYVPLAPCSGTGSSLASPPTSPFESQAHSITFSTAGSSQLSAGQGWTLPGEPTLPADHPLGTAALPGEPTQRAEVPLARRQPSSASAALASGASVALLQAGGGGSAQGAAAAPPAGDAVRPGQPGVRQQPGAAGGAAHAAAAAGGSDSDGDGDALPMHPLCPLDDAHLPLDTASLKSRQLGHALQLLTGEQGDADAAAAQLEALARLCWSDEAARSELQRLDALPAVVACMRRLDASAGVQCNGCLALMALVRGDDAASERNRVHLADCGGVEAVARGMSQHSESAMVQLSALLCLVPLALENSALQLLVARCCLPSILEAMLRHADEPEVVGKAMVLLGVLAQGEEEVHEAIRRTLVERTPFPRIAARVLSDLWTLDGDGEDVLWASLFTLAVLANDTSPAFVRHMVALAAAGVLPALRAALRAYRGAAQAAGVEPDEMIVRAGEFLLAVLTQARRLLWARRVARATRVALVGVLALSALRWLRQRAAHRVASGGGKLR